MKKHVLPAFGHFRLNAITRGNVRDFLLKKSTNYSRKRVLLFKDVISGVLNWAVDEELIAVNVTNGISKRLWPMSGSKDTAIGSADVFTDQQLQKFRKRQFNPIFPGFLGCGMMSPEDKEARSWSNYREPSSWSKNAATGSNRSSSGSRPV